MSVDRHPRRSDLGRFVEGALAAEDNRRIVRHLLAGCESCRRLTAELWRPAADEGIGPVVDRAIRLGRSYESRIEAERAAAVELLREFDRQAPSRQLLLALNSRRFRSWFLCEALLRRSLEAGPTVATHAGRVCPLRRRVERLFGSGR